MEIYLLIYFKFSPVSFFAEFAHLQDEKSGKFKHTIEKLNILIFFPSRFLQGKCQGFCSAALLFLFPPDAFAGIKWDQNYWASSRRENRFLLKTTYLKISVSLSQKLLIQSEPHDNNITNF